MIMLRELYNRQQRAQTLHMSAVHKHTTANVHSTPLTNIPHNMMSMSIRLYPRLWPTPWKIRKGIRST